MVKCLLPHRDSIASIRLIDFESNGKGNPFGNIGIKYRVMESYFVLATNSN